MTLNQQVQMMKSVKSLEDSPVLTFAFSTAFGNSTSFLASPLSWKCIILKQVRVNRQRGASHLEHCRVVQSTSAKHKFAISTISRLLQSF